LRAVIKKKFIKYTGKAIVLSFLSQFFSNCGQLKKRYKGLPKTYGEGAQERPETTCIHWHCKCLALIFRILCIILVLRGIFYTNRFHPGG